MKYEQTCYRCGRKFKTKQYRICKECYRKQQREWNKLVKANNKEVKEYKNKTYKSRRLT